MWGSTIHAAGFEPAAISAVHGTVISVAGLIAAVAFSGSQLTRVYARARRGIEAALGAALTALGVRFLATG